VLHNPKTRIVFDDARHYLMTTTDMYDVIASDPLDVFVKGTAALYSKEYFEAVKRHLNPGGSFSLYVPLYESDERTVRSELATFFEAFPNATVWANTINGQGYDMVFMGQVARSKSTLTRSKPVSIARITSWWRNPCATSASTPPPICLPLMPDSAPTWAVGPKAPTSTTMAICASLTWPVGASTQPWKTSFTAP